jgi:phage replication O-like protein O
VAKPELEDGYTQIPHKTVEHLIKMHLSPNQWQVLLFIFRKTYGFHKKVDYIANFQIVGATGLCKSVVSRMLRDLNDMQLITRKGKYIGVQEDRGKWRELAELSTSKGVSSLVNSEAKVSNTANNEKLAIPSTELAEQSTKVSSPRVTQKIIDTISKDTIQKIGGPSPQGLSAQTPASKYYFEKTGRKRWQNLVQKEKFEKAESEVGEARMLEAIDWALTSGISNIKSIITAAKKGGRHDAEGASPLRRPQTHQGVTPAYHQTTDEERRRAIT